jgi:succinoglycan biosynthesis protein ExoV
MKIFHWQSPQGNFGDDLNRWLWPALAPAIWGAEDDIVFVGVGSILNDRIPSARLRVVFGSGVGYRKPPPGHRGNDWRIYCVRGPLSARALGLGEEAAVCDSAILIPAIVPRPAADGARVVFVPHWSSARVGSWQRACEAAGIEFVDPRDDSRSVIACLAAARLVIAESMHAAIIADAFRRPWIAVRSSPAINAFKWQDWCQSLGLDYAPHPLPPSRLQEWIEHRCLPQVEKQASRALGTNGAASDTQVKNGVLLESYRRHDGYIVQDRSSVAHFLSRATRRGGRLAGRSWIGRGIDQAMSDRAADTLAKLARRPGVLSADRAIERATERLLDRLDRLKRDYAAGFPA